jgi:hypothetical protein
VAEEQKPVEDQVETAHADAAETPVERPAEQAGDAPAEASTPHESIEAADASQEALVSALDGAATDQLAADAGEHAPLDDAAADGAEAEDAADYDEEYELEHVIVVRRPIFIAGVAVAVLAIAALAALNVYQWKKPAPAVATVDGTTISRSDYDKMVARGNGQQVLDQLITQRLVENDARKHHVSATADEIDAKLKEAKSQFSTDQEYRQALDQNHVTELQLRDSLRLQVLLEKLVYDKVQVSDADVQQEYDKNKDTDYQGKTLDQVKDEIRKSLTDQKQQDALQAYVQNLRSSAKISEHVPGA